MKKIAALMVLFSLVVFAQQKGSFTDTRDGKTYSAVRIGNQIWMAENLNYNANGSQCYNNTPAYCDKYGRLYNWETAKVACPRSWHLPTIEEWEKLTATVGGESTAGKYLKATSGWNSYKSKSGNGTDAYGFRALPGGVHFSIGSSIGVGDGGDWWSSSVSMFDANRPCYLFMLYITIAGDGATSHCNQPDKSSLLSVRCVQD